MRYLDSVGDKEEKIVMDITLNVRIDKCKEEIFDSFREGAKKGVWTMAAADLPTPVAVVGISVDDKPVMDETGTPALLTLTKPRLFQLIFQPWR